MTTPPKPDLFNPEIPPPGYELKLVTFWQERPKMKPRMQLVHTNGAGGEGSVESSYNWSMKNLEPGALYGTPPGTKYYTIPHLQIDRSGRGAMLLPADRKGIANYKAAGFSLGFETADTGFKDDPTISAFTDKQAEAVAVACAYYAWGYDIPLAYPETWDGAGTASHTEPFGYPLWTNSQGKICPGTKKKRQVRDIVLPRAQEILAAWTATTPPVPEDVDLTQEELDALVDRIAATTTDKVWQRIMTFKPTNKPMPAEDLLEWIAAYAANADQQTRPPAA